MTPYIALLRGVNVGGRGTLPMKELVTIFERLGLDAVRTYIQSGNVVFWSERRVATDLPARISRAIEENRGFAPSVVILGADAVRRAVEANPFPRAAAEPKSLHVGFCDRAPRRPDLARLESLRQGDEAFHLEGAVLYLHLPSGVARSKLAAGAEKALGVPMTSRNWRTMQKLLEMAEMEPGRRG